MDTVRKVIDVFCYESGRFEGREVFHGIANNTKDFDRYLTNDFKPLVQAFNGIDEVYFSARQKSSVKASRGVVTITIYDNIQEYIKGYEELLDNYRK